MRKIICYLLFVFMITVNLFAQTGNSVQPNKILSKIFEDAAVKFNVPSDLLKSISYSETRFSNIIQSNKNRGPNQQPPVYGIMALKNDNWFGHSLIEGAKLIGANPDDVAVNEKLNIQAAAALLSSIADSMGIDRTNLNNWKPVLEKFSGIPQPDVKPFYSFGVFDALYKGETLKGIKISRHPKMQMNKFSSYVNPKNKLKKTASIQSIDYPPATWDPSPNFTRGVIKQLFLVVHVTQGSFANSVSWLKNPAARASAHYVIRSSDGYIVQLVREHNEAWHARCWNPYMIGVEHEGYVSTPKYFTEAMYKSSGALFRHLATTYNIPVNKYRIIGHYQWSKPWWVSWIRNTWNPAHPSASFDPTCNTHTDPGPYWNWSHFFNLINEGATKPNIISHLPALSDTVWSNTGISFSFDQSMAPQSIQSAFSITPSVNGNFKWTNGNKTFTFIPSSLLKSGTKYSVTLSNKAISILDASIDTNYTFEFYTKPAVPLETVNTYPNNNQNNISTTVKVIIEFNTPLVFSSLSGSVTFQDSTGKSVGLSNARYYQYLNHGFISFSSFNSLTYNSVYKVIIRSKVQSVVGTTLGKDLIVNFRTGNKTFIQGTVVENFESLNDWRQPSLNTGSLDIDTSLTKLAITYNNPPEGTYSGKLTYRFTGKSGGICKLIDVNEPVLGSQQKDKFGLWIYGDLSNNYVGSTFLINGNQEKNINISTLNWTGWKFFEIPFSNIAKSGEISFYGIYIKQNGDNIDTNRVYFDGIQYRDSTVTFVNDENNITKSKSFMLAQNYPNPFNPSTTIEYQIPKNEFVTLKVYDILGREITTLVNRDKNAGIHSVEFNIDNLSAKLTSGIYFYTLKAGSFYQTKKLVLMK